MNYLRNEHDTDGETSHKIDLQVFAPLICSNPSEARQEHFDPFQQSHPLHLRFPSGKN